MELMMIKVNNISFSYINKNIIESCSFQIKKDKVYVLMGPNGSGKSTLIRIINGYLKPAVGEVWVENNNVHFTNRKKIANYVGFIPQEHLGVFPYSVLEMVLMGRTPYIGTFSSPCEEDIKKAIWAIRKVGLESCKERSYMDLSGGERQLVFIARLLAQEAQYLLLDEPTAHLDFSNQKKIIRLLKQICREQHCGLLIAMHDPNQVISVADEVIMLNKGRIFKQGPTESVITEENLERIYSIPIAIEKIRNQRMVVIAK